MLLRQRKLDPHYDTPKAGARDAEGIMQLRSSRNWGPIVFYLALLVAFMVFIWVTAGYIAPRFDGDTEVSIGQETSAFGIFREGVQKHVGSSLGMLLIQVIVILIFARLIGWLFTKIKQPTVIGEIVAGILLGPTLLGAVWPDAFNTLFPSESLPFLELLSNFGLILFMFTIGMELRLADIRSQARDAVVISQSGIFIPLMLGMGAGIVLYREYAPHVPFLPMVLFMGVAMSITAFPVLARIIQEKQMNRTPFGKLTLNSAAAGDIFAWLLLAAIIAVSQSGGFTSVLYNFLFLILYLVMTFGVVRPLFRIIGKTYHKQELVTKGLVAFVFILLLISSYITEILSMHAFFGAFIFGLVMPEDIRFRHVITEKVEDVSLNIFLPLFFVSSGLKTDLTLINTSEMFLLALIMIAVAVLGKVGGTYIGARVCGLGRRESLYLGAYMNTRGLMELVVLKIGLDLGVLTPLLFSILVLMTLITTVMTTPMLHVIDRISKRLKSKENLATASRDKQILISFGRPETGISLLRLAYQIFDKEQIKRGFVVMHATLNSTVSQIDEESYYRDNFSPLEEEAKKLGIPIETRYKITDNIPASITEEANKTNYKFLLLGSGLELSARYSDREIVKLRRKLQGKWKRITMMPIRNDKKLPSILNENMKRVINNSLTDVGVLISRPFEAPQNIVLAVDKEEDFAILPLARNMATRNGGNVALLPFVLPSECKERQKPALQDFENNESENIPLEDNATSDWKTLIPESFRDEELKVLKPCHGDCWPSKCDFLFVSRQTWHRILDQAPQLLEELPATFIVIPSPILNDDRHIPATKASFE